MSKLLISTEGSFYAIGPMTTYLTSLRRLILSSNRTLTFSLSLIFILEIAILILININFSPTNTTVIFTLIALEASIIFLAAIFLLTYRTRSRVSTLLQKFNDIIMATIVFSILILKTEIFIHVETSRFVALVGGMTILPVILFADKALIRISSKLWLLGACFLYITARMIVLSELDYVVSLQILLVFISSAYFLKRREDTIQALFSEIFSQLQKEAPWQGICRDFPEPMYLLNSDLKVVFSNMASASSENIKSGGDDGEKMMTNAESARTNSGINVDAFRYIQDLELNGDAELAYQLFLPICFGGIDDSGADFLEDKDLQTGRKSSKALLASPKGFRFSWKNDSGSLGHIHNYKNPSDTMKVWLKGQNLVHILEVLCRNTKRFSEFYRKTSLVFSGKVIEENTGLLSPLRSTQRDRPKEISVKSVEVRLSVINFSGEQVVMIMVTEKTQANPASSLQSINEYKINLLASFSHEVRTPLNGNLNFLEAAIQRPDLPEDIKTDYLVPALISATLLFYIVSDILDYSQFGLNKIVLRIKSSKISCLLEEIVDLFRVQATKKNLKITLDYPENAEIATDHTRLAQILVNLMSNALKYTEEGGIHLSVLKTIDPPNCYKISVRDTGIGLTPKQKRKIERILKGEDSEKVGNASVGSNLGLTTSGRLAVLLGPNKGNGIYIEPIKKGTKLVFLVENRQLVQNEKSLLDLSLSGLIGISSKQAVDNSIRSEFIADIPNQGLMDLKDCTLRKSASSNDIAQPPVHLRADYLPKISTESQGFIYTTPEEGRAHFVSKLSLQGGMQKTKGVHKPVPSIFSTSGRKMPLIKKMSSRTPKCKCNYILIVDDDSFNVMAAEKLFTAVGLNPVSAFHGKQAIQAIETRERCCEACQLFKFILMDCNMPIMDGYEATRYLKQEMRNGTLPYIPIIGCTAFVTYFDAAKCFDSGMDDYETKPLGKEKTSRILEKWVRNRPRVQGTAIHM